MSRTPWTVEQAAELCLEQFLTLLEGADDDDEIRPLLVLQELERIWVPSSDGRITVDVPAFTVREARERIIAAREALARGEEIP